MLWLCRNRKEPRRQKVEALNACCFPGLLFQVLPEALKASSIHGLEHCLHLHRHVCLCHEVACSMTYCISRVHGQLRACCGNIVLGPIMHGSEIWQATAVTCREDHASGSPKHPENKQREASPAEQSETADCECFCCRRPVLISDNALIGDRSHVLLQTSSNADAWDLQRKPCSMDVAQEIIGQPARLAYSKQIITPPGLCSLHSGSL